MLWLDEEKNWDIGDMKSHNLHVSHVEVYEIHDKIRIQFLWFRKTQTWSKTGFVTLPRLSSECQIWHLAQKKIRRMLEKITMEDVM